MIATDEPLEVTRRRSAVGRRQQLRRLAWSLLQNTIYRFSFHTSNTLRASLLRAFGAHIGRHCTIRRTSRVFYPWLFEMGDLSSLGDEAEIYNLTWVKLGSRVSVSQQAYICAGSHDYTKREMPLTTGPITIGDDAWICARAFLAPNVTIGEGAIVGACGVVTSDVPPFTIVAGNPARAIKKRQLD